MDQSHEHLQKTEYSDLLSELTREAEDAVASFALDGEGDEPPRRERRGHHKAPSRLSKDSPSGWESVTGRLPFLKKETGRLPKVEAPALEQSAPTDRPAEKAGEPVRAPETPADKAGKAAPQKPESGGGKAAAPADKPAAPKEPTAAAEKPAAAPVGKATAAETPVTAEEPAVAVGKKPTAAEKPAAAPQTASTEKAGMPASSDPSAAPAKVESAPAEEAKAPAPEKPSHNSRRAKRESDAPSPLAGKSPAALWRMFWAELKQECVDFRAAVSGFLVRWSENFRRSNVNFHEVVAAKKNNDFPESSHFLLQLLLFLWGMLPCVINRMAERLLHRRSRKLRRSSRMTRFTERLHMHPGWFLGGAGILAAVVIFFSLHTFGTEVSFRGELLGCVSDADTALVALRRVEMATRETVNDNYSLDDSNLSTSVSLVLRSDLLTEDDLENLISEKVGLVTRGYALYIEGELICATTYDCVLEDLLEQLKYAYTTESTVACEFEEDVQIVYEYVPTRTVKRIGEIAAILNSSHQEEVIYQVKSGDVWSRIANDNGMTSAELLKLNPGYDPAMLHAGDELVLSAAVPYLTTTFTEQQHYVADIPYEVEYQDDDTMYKGDTKVLSAGVYGKADVVADVTYKNGEEISRTVLSYSQLTQPVTELQARGTKARPTWHATGSFRWPCTGTITSYYGGRNLWGKYNNHGGIDIANRRGTAIYAADGGTVTYAGWQGTYGYLVIINHGNGYETYYAHNSSLLVSKGDKVHKGEQIAKMGSTGNASGSHCHFEVRYNGSRRNPLNYLSR